MQKRTRVWVYGLSLAAVLAWHPRGQAYYEDDPAKTKSSAHWDLTLAMATCAGYGTDEATSIANADEATDVTDYGTGSTEAQFKFTSRSGNNMHYFHYPKTSLSAITGWGSGTGSLFIDQGSGTSTSCTHCCYNGANCVDGNTLTAFGIEIHSLGDSFSHKACVQAGGTDHQNFPDHTPGSDQMAYCPISQHTCEWGDVSGGDLSGPTCNTITAAQAAKLRQNALAGITAVRDAIYSRASGAGKAPIYQVSVGDLSTFAGYFNSADRVTFATTLRTKCSAMRPGTTRGEAAIDPLAVIFGSQSDTYIKLTLPDPAPIPVVVERVRAAARKLSPAGRRATQARIELLQQYLGAMQKELR
jgi:hypothetical protein